MNILRIIFVGIAVLSGGLAAWLVARIVLETRHKTNTRKNLVESAGVDTGSLQDGLQVKGLALSIIVHLLKRDINNKINSDPVDLADASKLEKRLISSGLSKRISLDCIKQTRKRFVIVALLAGALLGACFSNSLALLLGAAGGFLGFYAIPWALKQEELARLDCLSSELPEMLEVLALGLRSGLSFDKSFSLYHEHFSNCLSRDCASIQKEWEFSLNNRDDALRKLALRYDSPLLKRVVESLIRSLNFGLQLAENLDLAAQEASAQYKAKREEEVAKAPVKMMIPTGTLILPAMLLMVLGPVLLELMNGF